MSKLFEIDKDSVVKGNGEGYAYCCTTPPHPQGERRKDRDKKYIYYHRALMEQKLGRFLSDDEEVDHIDENTSNNSLSNLRLKKKGEHQQDHAKKNKFWKHSPRTKPRKSSILKVMSNYRLIALD